MQKNHVSNKEQEGSVMKEGVILLLLGITIVLVIMNTMMFNLALPDVAKAFQLSASSTSWIVTGYSIVFAISSITYSRLADFVPIRRLFIIGILSLSLGAIAGLFSNSFAMLLIVRILQASGAGSIPALSLVLISRYIPMARRGKAMAMIMSSVAFGLGFGPVVGGFIVEFLGWHLLFVITAVTLLLVPLYMMFIPKEEPRKGSFDVIGALLIGVGTTGLLLYLTNHSWISLLTGLVSIALFIVRIRSAKDPFVLPSLFANRSFLILGAVGIAAYLCSFATLFLMPQILVKQYHLSAIQAGLVIFPGSFLAMMISRQVGRIIDTRGNSAIIRYTPLLLLTSVVLFALFEGTSFLSIMFIYMLMSVSYTILTSSISNEMSRLLLPSQIASGLGLFQLLQFFSGAFGVAATASALVWQKDLSLAHAYSNVYWGLTLIVLLSIVCAIGYLRSGLHKPQAVS
ncbi:MFS transporter [Paenibacillus aceris]|uniref:DHA2 family metal-tetracycline-proton antiporter-like MFS transporter n=1 Tax=Paenibacillus aceris TaxID=869555 RepID=A0ABS4I3X5_9BACL|nr:MFS transporter [Paenibacillus aceris]MBP1965513.1 DHA2 family metal-tetracycline-proton antiporter-like MFS transporter [Paenibacillus aceris]NHW33438.1 MFS transporter [Paenibacillus aceris]